jgi:Peptidase family S41
MTTPTEESRTKPVNEFLTAQAIEEDLQFLETTARLKHSYFSREKQAFLAALNDVRVQAKNGMSKSEFIVAICLAIAVLKDGHGFVSIKLLDEYVPNSRLPFVAYCWQQRFLAVHPNLQLLDPEFPFLKSMDGVPLQTWVRHSSEFFKSGVEAMQLQNAARCLRYLGYLRRKLDLPDSVTVHIELESLSGESKSLEMSVTDEILMYKPKQAALCRVLEGNIGCLSITGMDNSKEFLESLIPAMHDLRDTNGLIIDVRGNRGGTRHALRALFPFFLQEGEQRLYTVASVRIPEGEPRDDPEGYLQDRFLHPITSSIWTDEEREVVTAFARDFKPAWEPPVGEFSVLHYGLLPRTEQHFYYPHKVVVLMDVWCASATDVFLGAFKGWRNVTLMGTNSMGTSGRPDAYTMPNSGIEFLMSTMVSYRPDGQLYERLGIQPDTQLEPTLEDFMNGTDGMLETARVILTDA